MRFPPRFSLLTLLLLTTTAAIVFALSFNLPVNRFALDRITATADRPLTRLELVVRLLVFGALLTMMFAGVVLMLREYSRSKKR
jgi:hypothetical protein